MIYYNEDYNEITELSATLSSVSLIPKPPMKALITVIKKTRMRMVLFKVLAVS